LKPYIAFFKTYNNVLKIQNGEKIQFLDNQNSEICNKCKNKFYCSNLENKILFPFNIEIIKKIFNGIPLIKKNPRIMLDNIRLILQKYLSRTNPYDSLNSMDITLNESVSIDNFNGFSQDEINFLKWYGLDYQLFELFFEKPFPKHQNPIVKKISEKSKENKITIILDEELSKLVNNIHKFTTNCFNFKDQEVEKIYKLCNKYFLQKCHFLFYNPYLKLNNLRLKYASTPIFYFKDKFDKKGEIQFQIDIENWNELIIAHIIKYQYFIDSNKRLL
jgi:hypothetical protein